MPYHHPFELIAFHSCDREIGLAILKGEDDLKPSNNSWDWLADGIYFWEQNPLRALEYAVQCASGIQRNKVKIKTPFVLGCVIELGNCLNLVESGAPSLLTETYEEMEMIYKMAETKMPVNEGAKRELDCAVIKYIHQTNAAENNPPYDSVRCSFGEGKEAYSNSNFTSQLHIQICLRNPDLIKGYFLPRPLEKFNPYLKKDFFAFGK